MKKIRTIISQMVLEVIAGKMDSQDKKGIEKYGRTLDKVPFKDYDWNEMALEEMVDCSKYLMMENAKLRRENAIMKEKIANQQITIKALWEIL